MSRILAIIAVFVINASFVLAGLDSVFMMVCHFQPVWLALFIYARHAARGQDTFRSEAPPLATLPLKTGGEWLKRWLKDPKSIDPNATMPNFHLTDQAIDELSHFLFAAQVPKELAGLIEAAAAEPPGSSANGKKLVSERRIGKECRSR